MKPNITFEKYCKTSAKIVLGAGAENANHLIKMMIYGRVYE